MDGLNEIATTGAPAIVTALGMGTVFSCLILLYVITRLLGSALPRLILLRENRKSRSALAAGSEGEAAEALGSPEPPATAEDTIAAGIALALARHRSARVAPAAEEPRGADPWKIAGRMQVLRAK